MNSIEVILEGTRIKVDDCIYPGSTTSTDTLKLVSIAYDSAKRSCVLGVKSNVTLVSIRVDIPDNHSVCVYAYGTARDGVKFRERSGYLSMLYPTGDGDTQEWAMSHMDLMDIVQDTIDNLLYRLGLYDEFGLATREDGRLTDDTIEALRKAGKIILPSPKK